MTIRRAAFTLLLTLAFAAGPVAAACADCCLPSAAPSPASTVAAPDCCGCAEALQLPADRDAVASSKIAPASSPALLDVPWHSAAGDRASGAVRHHGVLAVSPSPRSRSTPARL